MNRRRAIVAVAAVLVVGALSAALALETNAFGVKDRVDHLVARIELFLDPPPDRPTIETVTVTPRPRPTATPTPSSTPTPDPGSSASAAPPPTPAPTPVRRRVDVDILTNPDALFAHELRKDWCAPAGVQMVLAIHGRGDTSARFQEEIASRVEEWESRRDSLNGEWGPAAMAEALAAYGVPGYQLRAYESRDDALFDAAAAISETQAPVILLAWRGAHTWVMTGYRADADPTVFADATISGAYILDPWYPWVSSIWGPSDPPGTFQDAAEMKRNFLPWKRPEGHYPDRDGKFIVLLPTVRLGSG